MLGQALSSIDRWLAPAADWIIDDGWRLALLAIEWRWPIGALATIAAVLLLLAAGRERRAELALLTGAVLLGVWGQIALFSDYALAGTVLYGLAFLTALRARTSPFTERTPPVRPLEVAGVLALTAAAFLARTYAIRALPAFVDIEPTGAFLQSLSAHGLSQYILENRVRDDGFAHMLIRAAMLHLTGPSVLGIRLAGVAVGTAAIPIIYMLVRGLGGRAAALIAALLLLAAPEHLIFSRIEATHIIVASVASMLTVAVTLSWLRRQTRGPAILAMLWIPLTRYFYAAAIALFALPLVAGIASLLSGALPSGRRHTLAFIAAGTILWFAASPALHVAAGGEWNRVSTLQIYGRSLLQPFYSKSDEGLLATLPTHIERLVGGSGAILKRMAYRHPGFSAWYLRDHPDPLHQRMTQAGYFVPFIAGLGLLFASIVDFRSQTLLLWCLLGTLPATLSGDPEVRRLAAFYPAMCVVAGLWFGAFLHTASTALRPLAARIVAALTAAIVLSIAITAMAAHLRIHSAPLLFSDYTEFTRPIFGSSDRIFHNLDAENTSTILVFGNADIFLRRLPSYRLVRDWNADWSAVTDNFDCSFADDVYRNLLDERQLARLRCLDPNPRVTYLLRVRSVADRRLLRRLRWKFPDADLSQVHGTLRDDPFTRLVALSFDVTPGGTD